MPRKNPARRVTNSNYNSAESNRDGAMRELIATKLLMERGYTVSNPNMDVRYDLIAEKYPTYIRVQVKHLKLEHKATPEQPLSVDQYSISAFSKPQKTKLTYSKADCDVVMGVDLSTGMFAIVPVEKIPSSGKKNLSSHPTSDGHIYLNSFLALEEMTNGN